MVLSLRLDSGGSKRLDNKGIWDQIMKDRDFGFFGLCAAVLFTSISPSLEITQSIMFNAYLLNELLDFSHFQVFFIFSNLTLFQHSYLAYVLLDDSHTIPLIK